MSYDGLAFLIEEKQGSAVDFGDKNSDIIPKERRILETERILNVKLPPSYVWFLQNYGGGTVFGDDIYSISKKYSPTDMFDIASKTISDRSLGYINDDEVVICTTDFGEKFLMCTSDVSSDGEYPVIRKMGNNRERVADNFAKFLYLYISEKIS